MEILHEGNLLEEILLGEVLLREILPGGRQPPGTVKDSIQFQIKTTIVQWRHLSVWNTPTVCWTVDIKVLNHEVMVSLQ